MAIKPNAKTVYIKEQIIEDEVSGLTLMFSAYPDDGLPEQARLRIIAKDLPFGNRDFIFGRTGGLGATGTATGGICETSWIEPVQDEETERKIQQHREEVWARDRARGVIYAEETGDYGSLSLQRGRP